MTLAQRRSARQPHKVTCAAAHCTDFALVDDLERADRMRGRWRCAEHRRPLPSATDDDLVDVTCAQPGCRRTTSACAPHANKLDGRWRCRTHYAGTGAPPTRKGP